MEKLEWVFQLVDQVTGPAKRAAESTQGFEKELKKVEAQLARVKTHPLEFKQLKAAKNELRELSGGGRSFAQRVEEIGNAVKRTAIVQNLMLGVEAMHLLYDAGEKVVDVAIDIGREMVTAAGHAERMKISFQAIAGNEGAAEALEYIEKISKASELSSAQLQDMASQLMTAGFHAKDLSNALPAALDIAGFMGGGADKVQQAVMGLARIRTTGRVESRSLMSMGLGENAEQNLLARMAQAKGQSVDAVKKAMEAGKLNPQEVLYQVYQMIIERQHGALGTTAEKMTNTVLGRMKKLRELPEEIFEKWADSPGFTKFSASLQKILDKLDPNGPNGKKIFAAIDRISSKVVDLVDNFVSGDGIDKFIDSITNVDKLLHEAKTIIDDIVTVSEVLATIWAGSKIVGMVSGIAGLLPTIASGAGMAASAIGSFGGVLGQVMTAVISPAGLTIAAMAVEIYEIVKAVQAFREANAELNPQRIDKMAGIKKSEIDRRADVVTQQTARKRLGMGLGLTQAEKDALKRQGINEQAFVNKYSKAQSLVADSGIPAPSARTKGGGALVNQSITLHPGAISINAPNSNPDEIAGAVNQSLPGAIQQAQEKLASASGVI